MSTRLFVVWEPALGQGFADGRSFSAEGPQHAAELWADWSDYSSNEYHIVNGQPATVMVSDVEGCHARELIVSGDQIRRYAAKLRIAAPNVRANLDANGVTMLTNETLPDAVGAQVERGVGRLVD